MSANDSNRLSDVHRSGQLAPTSDGIHPISQSVAVPARAIHQQPLLDPHLKTRLRGANALSAAKPTLKKPTPAPRGTYHQNAISRSSIADVRPPWQSRAAIRSGALSIPVSGTPASDRDGDDVPRLTAGDRFGHEAKDAKNVIVLIDERTLVRDCLMHCLQAAYIDREIFAFRTLSDWINAEDDYPTPSVILLCIRSHRKQAVEGLDDPDRVARLAASVPLIIISEVEDAARIMDAIESGARGYIPTSMTLSIAVEAVRLVEAGGTFVPVNCVMPSSQNPSDDGGQLFTTRQIMVIEALCRGKANKQIAFELGMCESTVKVHIRHIMRKLKARNRTEVAMMVSNLFGSLDQRPRPETQG